MSDKKTPFDSKNYICKTCKETFDSISKLTTHNKVEHQEILEFTYLGQKRYIKRNHEGLFVCPLCKGNSKYKSPNSFHRHIRNKRRNITQRCPSMSTASSKPDYEQSTTPENVMDEEPTYPNETAGSSKDRDLLEDRTESCAVGNKVKREAVSRRNPFSSDRGGSKKGRYEFCFENGEGFVKIPYLEFVALLNRSP
jgi:hypothetical protein